MFSVAPAGADGACTWPRIRARVNWLTSWMQSLEASVFLHPLLDLREQVLGHVDGAGLAPVA